MTPKGEFNHAIIVLGVPGCGKSTWATQRALELGRSTPAYVVAHDPGWRLPKILPDGRPTPLHRHESVASAQAALRSTPGGIHAIATADGEEVLRFGQAISKASLDANGGEQGVPTVVYLDEGVGTGGASAYRLGEGLREHLALRRHLHTGLIITAQDPRLIHYAFLGLATELVIFRLNDQAALNELRRMGVPPEMVDQVAKLEKYHCVVHKLG